MNDAGAIWVYVVARAGTLSAADPLVGVAGGRVRLVSVKDLASVVSPVDLAEFGEEPLRRNMEHLPWLEAVARMHHDVVSAMAKVTAVVPMRLATVYRTEERLAQMLEQRKEDFLSVLGQIAGRSEWGVKAYVAATAKADAPPEAAASPSAGRRSGAPAAPRSGAAYLMKRRAQLTAAQEVRRAAIASAKGVHSELAGQAAAAALHRPQDPQLSGTSENMIMNATYLVDDRDQAEFAAAVERAGSRNPAVRLELTGPWPPYSFAAPEPGAETVGTRASL